MSLCYAPAGGGRVDTIFFVPLMSSRDRNESDHHHRYMLVIIKENNVVTKTFPPLLHRLYYLFLPPPAYYLLYFLSSSLLLLPLCCLLPSTGQVPMARGAGLSVLDNEELTWGKLPLISGTYRKSTPNKARRASGARHLVSIG